MRFLNAAIVAASLLTGGIDDHLPRETDWQAQATAWKSEAELWKTRAERLEREKRNDPYHCTVLSRTNAGTTRVCGTDWAITTERP